MQIPCLCMIIEQEDGSSMCRQCHGDWYGCECPQVHSIKCEEHPDNIAKAKLVIYGDRAQQYYDYHN